MTAKKTKKKLSDYITIIVGIVLLTLAPVVNQVGVYITSSTCERYENGDCTFDALLGGSLASFYGSIVWAGVAIAIILVGVVIATAKKTKK